MDINLGQVSLTNKQVARMSEAQDGIIIRGFKYKDGELTVNHQSDTLTEKEKKAIIASVTATPDKKSNKDKKKEDLKNKPVWTFQELIEIVKELI